MGLQSTLFSTYDAFFLSLEKEKKQIQANRIWLMNSSLETNNKYLGNLKF